MKKVIIFLLTTIFSAAGFAQFKLSGEFRPRTEYSHGYGALASENQKASLFTGQRTRLNLEYNTTDIKTKLVLQDVRIWGSQRQLVSNEDFGVSVHEAWAEARIMDKLALRLGRQELVYDNHRIFGNVGWAQQGRSHDLALLKYNGSFQAHVGVAYNESAQRNNNFYFGPDAYKFMQFVWLNKSFRNIKLSLLALNNGVPRSSYNDNREIISQDIIYTQTIGPYVEYTLEAIKISGNIYYQTGTLIDDTELSALEYLVQADWKASDKLSAGLAYEVLSGTDISADEAGSRSFTPLYGTNHKFNGHMDYFYVGNHGASVGLKDLTGRLKYALGKVKLGCDVHGFWTDAPIEGTEDTYLGTEIDLSASIAVNNSVSMVVGYSQLLATDAMEMLKGGKANETHNWAWLMFTFKPDFLK